jgi:gamma-glutamyltranspeptidase/glutathione hydrolase
MSRAPGSSNGRAASALAAITGITLLATSACSGIRADTPPTPASAPTPAPAPAAGTLQSGHHAIVVAATPLAAKAGLDILRAGGSAADAAVAMQAVLGLVEPQSSGLGGGAFISYYDAHSRKVIAYNGRETAPAAATPNLFLDDAGKPLPFARAVLSGRSTGVPGAIAALYRLQHEIALAQPVWRSAGAGDQRIHCQSSTAVHDQQPGTSGFGAGRCALFLQARWIASCRR